MKGQPCNTKQAPVLLFVGRLVAHKGPAEAAEAFNLARPPGTHMIIVGSFDVIVSHDESYLNRLRAAVSNSSGKIHLAGAVPQEVMPAYYKASDAVIVPSIGGEGLQKVIIEALAMGRPIIASDRGGAWELLDAGKNAWLLANPDQPEAIARTLQVVFQDLDKLRRMKEHILVNDRPRMDEEKMVREFASAIHSCLAS